MVHRYRVPLVSCEGSPQGVLFFDQSAGHESPSRILEAASRMRQAGV
jgi:hypothetical protein